MSNAINKRKVFLFIPLFFFFISCQNNGYVDIDETPEYMQAHPDCIVGTYYNYYTRGALSYIQLRSDSTFIHVFKYRNINHIDSGKWTYKYNDGQNDIEFETVLSKFETSKRLASTDTVVYSMPLLGCDELFFSEDNDRLNFYKVKPPVFEHEQRN